MRVVPFTAGFEIILLRLGWWLGAMLKRYLYGSTRPRQRSTSHLLTPTTAELHVCNCCGLPFGYGRAQPSCRAVWISIVRCIRLFLRLPLFGAIITLPDQLRTMGPLTASNFIVARLYFFGASKWSTTSRVMKPHRLPECNYRTHRATWYDWTLSSTPGPCMHL